MPAYSKPMFASALLQVAASVPMAYMTIDQCSSRAELQDLASVQSGVLHVQGAQQSLYAAYRAWGGYGAVGSKASFFDTLVRPFTFAWSDIAITYYDADVKRIPDSQMYITITNSSDRARSTVDSRLRLEAATAWLDYFGITGRSDLLLKATWWLLDPLGVFTAAGSEVWSAVVEGTRDSLGVDIGKEFSTLHGAMPHTAAAVEEVQGVLSKFMAANTALGGASASSRRPPGPRVGIAAGHYKPHAQLSPYATSYIGWAWLGGKASGADGDDSAVGPPAYFTCEVNPLSLRFPAWLALGIAFAQAASNPALASMLLYSTAATMGFTFAVFMVMSFLYRHRTSKIAWLGAVGSGVAALFGRAEGGLAGMKAALAGTPLQPLAEYWPWMVLLFVLGTTLTSVYFAGQIASSNNPVTWRLLRLILQAASVACIQQAGHTKAVTLPLILAVHGGGLIVEALAVTCSILSFLEEMVDTLLQWTLGLCVPIPHLRLVREGAVMCGCGGKRADRRRQWGEGSGDVMEGVVEGGGYEESSGSPAQAIYPPRYSGMYRGLAPTQEAGYTGPAAAAAASLRRRRGSMANQGPTVGQAVSGLAGEAEESGGGGGRHHEGSRHVQGQRAALEYIEGVGVCMRTPDGQLYPVPVENLPASPAPAPEAVEHTGRPSLYSQAVAAAPAPGPARTHSEASNWAGWLPSFSAPTITQGGMAANVQGGLASSSSASGGAVDGSIGRAYALPRGLKRRSGSFSAPAAVAAAYTDTMDLSYGSVPGHGARSSPGRQHQQPHEGGYRGGHGAQVGEVLDVDE